MRYLLAYKSHPLMVLLLSCLLGKKGAIAGFAYNSLLALYNYGNSNTVVTATFIMMALYNVLYYCGCCWISKRSLLVQIH